MFRVLRKWGESMPSPVPMYLKFASSVEAMWQTVMSPAVVDQPTEVGRDVIAVATEAEARRF